jgi:hypothetical protein
MQVSIHTFPYLQKKDVWLSLVVCLGTRVEYDYGKSEVGAL